MANTPMTAGGGEMRQIAARLERLPYSSWHRNMRLIICSAWFFDSFDSITIAYVLPSLIAVWHLNPAQIPQMIGSLIAIGFAGQLIGAIGFGWIGECWGRLNSMVVTLLIFTLGGLACAFTSTYDQMWFIIGAIPALIVIPLRLILPESPRWLASRGRFDEADVALRRIEAIGIKEGKGLPPSGLDAPMVEQVQPHLADLFKGIYFKRTIAVWLIWIGAYVVTYGLTAWAPSLFNIVYHLPVQQSLAYGLILSGFGLGGSLLTIYLIEAIGRKAMFVIGLGVCCLPLLSFVILGQLSALSVLLIISSAFFFCSFLSLGLATYTAEIYPTQLRALGGGVASAWQRAASMAGPIVVGWVLPLWGVNAVFVVFGLFSLMGCLVALFFAIETRGQVLEQLSPADPGGGDALSIIPKA